jgi:hypothetical protein
MTSCFHLLQQLSVVSLSSPVGVGSSESCGRYAEVMMSSSQFPHPHCFCVPRTDLQQKLGIDVIPDINAGPGITLGCNGTNIVIRELSKPLIWPL